MIPSLPTELLRIILEKVQGDLDLANCSSTSKSFLYIARPLLYSTVRFFVRDWDDESYEDEIEYRRLDLLDESTWYLIETLAGTAHLQVLVRRIIFTSGGSDNDVPSIPVESSWICNDMEYFNFLFRLSSLEEIVLEDPYRIDKVDEVISKLQALQPSSSCSRLTATLRLVRERHLNEYTNAWNLQASCTSLDFRGTTAFSTSAATFLLASSLNTLQTLSIPFDETALLPDYSQLKHLELTFLLPVSSYTELQSIAQELYESLPKLPALETLVLSDSIQPDLPTPFPTEPLSYSLPPTLTSLSLEGHFVPYDLSDFIRTLPRSSKLTRLYVQVNAEEESKGELEVECAKRGIRLTLYEVWEKKI